MSPYPPKRLRKGEEEPLHKSQQRMAKSLILAATCCLLYYASRFVPQIVDKYYTQRLFPLLNFPFKCVAMLVPFSLGELALGLILSWILIHLGRELSHTYKKLQKKEQHPFHPLARWGMHLVTGAALAISAFILLGGFNYNSTSFAEKAGYNLQASSVEELEALCRELSQKISLVREDLQEDSRGVVNTDLSLAELLESASQGYKELSIQYSYLDGSYPIPKPVMVSTLLCYLQITGIYPYFVPEALVNYRTPLVSLPSTICHEMAHQRGFAREDEANYIAYLACIHHADPLFVYSGYYLAYSYSMNALYQVNQKAWKEIADATNPGVYRDIAASNQFWEQFDRPENILADLSESVNDTFLHVNNVQDGIHSYGRVVDLLLAERRATQPETHQGVAGNSSA